ncbi:MAG: DNA recombination protein RmuC [Desulfocapsa sp.]|nr:DNA recombination protein RmuC [Desulfocapsa sp.]
METFYSAIFLLSGMSIGAGIVYVFFKSRIAFIEESAAEKARTETHGIQLVLEEKLKSCEQDKQEILQDIKDVDEEIDKKEGVIKLLTEEKIKYKTEAAQLPVINEKLKEKADQIQRLSEENKKEAAARAKAEERNSHLVKLEKAITEKEENIHGLTERIADEKAAYSELKTRSDEQAKNNEERLKEFHETKNRMKIEFENLANTILEEKTKRFSDQNITNLNDLLKPMREQLGDFRKRVDQIHHEDSKDRTTLQEQISQLNNLNQQMNKEAKNLTRALKGDKKAQGNWGEMILERVLEQSGLRKGVEYETQGGFRNADNHLLKPDVIVHLPEGKDIIIDSKVSLIHYNEYVNGSDEREQQAALKAHVQSVSNHIKALSEKDYTSLKELRSLDFVLMFMPIDAAFMAAFQQDEQLFSTAFENKIIVVTPTTLLATLRTIENIWRYERQNENARLVAGRAGLIYDKLRGFLEDFEKIGKQLDAVHATYDTAMNKLTFGKGNLIRQAESFAELGVKVKKQLPKDIVDMAA